MGFRSCYSGVLDPCASWDGSARGPRSVRSDYDADWDAAGHPFHEGEREQRGLHVDNLSRRRTSDDCVRTLSSYSDAAGGAGARIEVRSLSVDDRAVRRARSEPPNVEAQHRLSGSHSLRAFGVQPCMDCGSRVRRRSISPAVSPTSSRSMSMKVAVLSGDVSNIMRKKQFHDSPAPGSSLSPRMAARELASICIDSPTRRRQLLSRVSSGIVVPEDRHTYDIPASRDSCQLFPGSPRNRETGQFFKKSVEARNYAKLVGRPGSTTTAIQELAMLSEVEVTRQLDILQRSVSGDTRMMIHDIYQACSINADARQRSKESSADLYVSCQSETSMTAETSRTTSPIRSPTLKPRHASLSFSNVSTVASDSDLLDRSSGHTPLSATSRSIFLPHAEAVQENDDDMGNDPFKLTSDSAPNSAPYSFMAEEEEPDSEPGIKLDKVPLGLRRILNSVLNNMDNIPEEIIGEFKMKYGHKALAGVDKIAKDAMNSRGQKQRYPLRTKALSTRPRTK